MSCCTADEYGGDSEKAVKKTRTVKMETVLLWILIYIYTPRMNESLYDMLFSFLPNWDRE